MESTAYLENFTQVIEQNIDPDNLDIFYNNIKNLKIVKKIGVSNPFYAYKTAGKYDSKKNEIIVYELDVASIYHELFHMASGKYEDGSRYDGFATNRYDNVIGYVGHGLNEGYTELLTRVYFPNDSNSVTDGYEYLTYIASMIELIVGKENMHRYYFTANLAGLIDELSNYVPKYVVESLIGDMDYLHKSLDKNNYLRRRKLIRVLREVKTILARILAKKLVDLYANGEITKEELVKKIASFNDCLIGDDECSKLDVTKDEDINKYLKPILSPVDESIMDEYVLTRERMKQLN